MFIQYLIGSFVPVDIGGFNICRGVGIGLAIGNGVGYFESSVSYTIVVVNGHFKYGTSIAAFNIFGHFVPMQPRLGVFANFSEKGGVGIVDLDFGKTPVGIKIGKIHLPIHVPGE